MITALLFTLLTAQPQVVLGGLDPLELIAGKEVPGSATHSATVGRHIYYFSSAENKKKFEANPYAYAVQNGGACGRMGSMTGKGSPDRFAVVDKKIYLFASDGCKSGFLSNLDDYRVPPDAPPKATPEQVKKAKDLHASMMSAHGAKPGMTIEWVLESPYEQDGEQRLSVTSWSYRNDSQYAYWINWYGGSSFFVRDGSKAIEGQGDHAYQMHPGEQRDFRAAIHHDPLFIAVGAGGTPVASNGSAFTLADKDIVTTVHLDDKSRIAMVEYVDRIGGYVRHVESRYSDYATVDGFTYPQTREMRIDGGKWGAPRKITRVIVNGNLPDIFSRAK
ncbi:hypothetical protein QPK87_37420 [Kamptonema cortianum]|nr:hypothetical protein [Geitlerinema splendidum]MDK3162188.1 hypothetical protein [Kamptonema cortianum]